MEQQRYAYALRKWEERKAYLTSLSGTTREFVSRIENSLNDFTAEEKPWMIYLLATLPTADLVEYTPEEYRPGIRHALMLRETMPWCRELPEDIFTDYVFYPRINTEDYEEARPLFYEELLPRVQHLIPENNIEQAILETNFWCQEHATYQMADDRTKSAMTVYRSGFGRCGEESTFTVTSLRSIGIPARQVYAPWWSHCDDNHAWVEAYIHGEWHFMGACEPAPRYDVGWFTNASSRAMVEHARTFTGAATAEDLAVLYGDRASRFYVEDGLTYEIITDHYARVAPVKILVQDENGQPQKDVLVRFEILNMAEYLSAANIHTDRHGEICLMLGLGNVHLHAIDEKTGRSAEKLIQIKAPTTDSDGRVVKEEELREEQEFVIRFGEDEFQDNTWQGFDFLAPLDEAINPGLLTNEEKEIRHQRMERGNELRLERLAGFYDAERAKSYRPAVQERLQIAGGNFYELIHFLENAGMKDLPLREALLLQLSRKDMTDVKASVLEEHLVLSAEYSRDYPEELYVPYILSPRVENERLTTYRAAIEDALDEGTKKKFRRHSREILTWMDENLITVTDQDYADLFYTPARSIQSGLIGRSSRQILLVAICRTLGIPARLDPITRAVEYYDGKTFVKAEADKKSRKETAHITLTAPNMNLWIDRQTYTLCRKVGGFYHRLDMPKPVSLGDRQVISLDVEPGEYRILTINRLPNGHSYANGFRFAVKTGEEKEIPLTLREVNLLETVSHNPIFDFDLQERPGERVSVKTLLKKPTNLLVWLEEGKEPTEHILNEMLQQESAFRNAKADIFFILKSPEAMEQVTLKKALEHFPKVRVIYDDFTDTVNSMARRMYVETEKLPLVVLMHDGLTGIYASSGYNVGLGDILIRLIDALEG